MITGKTLADIQTQLEQSLPALREGEFVITLSREGIEPPPPNPDVANLLLQIRSLFELHLPAPIQYTLIFSDEPPTLYFLIPAKREEYSLCIGDISPDEPLDRYLSGTDWDLLLEEE